jgi:alkylation response protein AidB-like acyl-CoA dehydrogenase
VLADIARESATVTGQPVLDETRRLAAVTVDGIRPDRYGHKPADRVQRQLDRGAVAVAATALAWPGDAAGTRRLRRHAPSVRPPDRFVPGGQARLRRHAGSDPGGSPAGRGGRRRGGSRHDATVAAAMAKAYATEAAVAVAGKAMQLHGGIGYTWESGITSISSARR